MVYNSDDDDDDDDEDDEDDVDDKIRWYQSGTYHIALFDFWRTFFHRLLARKKR